MAILIHLYYTGQQGSAKRFAQEMLDSGTVQAIRAEPGNLRYAYFFPMEKPETVLLMDMWEDQAALDRHHAPPPHDGNHHPAAGKISAVHESGTVSCEQ